MRIRDYAVAMAAYNAWMNDNLYACASRLTDAERKRDLGAFFKSIHGTLNHLLLADLWWLDRLTGRPLIKATPSTELHADFDELRGARRGTDERLTAWAASLDDAFGDAGYRFYSVTYGRERALPGWAVVVQIFNHETHHRGQVTTLLKQLGQDPGPTDFPWMPYFDDAQA